MTVTSARPTRRTLVRGAAWSVPVVSVVAAAPAFAASTVVNATLSGGAADKWGKDTNNLWHVSWDLTLTQSSQIIDHVSITVTYAPTMKDRGFDTAAVRSFNPTDNGWDVTINPVTVVGEYSVTAAHAANITAGTETFIHLDFAGANSNSAGSVRAVGTVTYLDGTTSALNIDAISWSPGAHATH